MKRRALLLVFAAAASTALAVHGARAGGDCLAPLAANPGWSCHAELSTGGTVDYCLEPTSVFGSDPASRFFKMNVTGPYPRTCSCGAKGKPPGARYGEDATYACLDRETDTVEQGKISRRKIVGETFNVSANVRSRFTCKPDPACDLPTVIDPDLPPEYAAVALAAGGQTQETVDIGGDVAVGYLPDCAGFTTETPTYAVEVGAASIGEIFFYYSPHGAENLNAALVVVSPSGRTHCVSDNELSWAPPEAGTYRIWLSVGTAGETRDGLLVVEHLVP